ncbi:unnamed protein product [Rotaria sordida]|uniref:Uncharacterized protein n=1 Tax=Rotaria sordida TaxID=392033 RepID=A0A815QTM7_9BILA|nr:unnamed protein product [Rotaria sordida]CAF1467565.1 unnamed protein product [Rotaria sordida]
MLLTNQSLRLKEHSKKTGDFKKNKVFQECLVLEKEQSEESSMQLCQQVTSMYVLINTTNNNDSPVKIEMDIKYVHHQCII